MEFLLIGLIFLILLLLMIWKPFFKQKVAVINDVANIRDETNIRLYHEHKKEIEKDYREGGIDEENYQYLLSELDNALLQDIESTSTDEKVDTTANKAFSPFWPLGLSIFVIIFSVALYNKQGNYKLLTELPEGHAQHQAMSKNASEDKIREQRKNEAMAHIEKIKAHISSNPSDTEAWYNLGQTYVAIGAFDAAVAAFTQVINIEGEHADLLGAIAQALYYKNNQVIDEQVQSYIDKALALDINDPSTNILLGMHNFIENNYQKAISYWQRVIDSNNKGVNTAALNEAISEAKARLGEPNMPIQPAAISGPQLKVSISLSDKVLEKLSQGEDRVVFIYAVPTNGQRMPLAAIKMKASDLPAVVELNNSQAMSPANNLGSVENAHVYAVVSMQGGVGMKSGDYKAEALSVDVNSTETLELIINTQVE